LDFNEKLGTLIFNLGTMNSMAVAFSGGVDSGLLLKVAHGILGQQVLAVIINTPALPRRDLQDALDFVKELRVNYRVIEADPLQIEGFAENRSDRCYLCKRDLFRRVWAVAEEHGISWVADGSNCDDLNDDRPGMQALRELDVVSPLIEAQLSKAEIREMARRMQLKIWDKPAAACLASRFAYGQKISLEKLQQVEAAETYLSDLGFRQIRVRSHDNDARIEVAPEERTKICDQQMMDAINEKFKTLGFAHASMDLGGYRCGLAGKSKKD